MITTGLRRFWPAAAIAAIVAVTTAPQSVAVTDKDTSVRRDSIRNDLPYDPKVSGSWKVTLP